MEIYSPNGDKVNKTAFTKSESSLRRAVYLDARYEKMREDGSVHLNQEIPRRTSVTRLLPNREFCLRVSIAVVVQIHEDWVSDKNYITVKNQG